MLNRRFKIGGSEPTAGARRRPAGVCAEMAATESVRAIAAVERMFIWALVTVSDRGRIDACRAQVTTVPGGPGALDAELDGRDESS